MKDWLANLRANLEYLWDRYGDTVLFTLAVLIRLADLALLLAAVYVLSMAIQG